MTRAPRRLLASLTGRQLEQAPLLHLLDDLGAESPTPWAREKLLQLVVHRHNARIPTVVTSRSLADLPAALASRLRDTSIATTLRLAAPDYRERTHD